MNALAFIDFAPKARRLSSRADTRVDTNSEQLLSFLRAPQIVFVDNKCRRAVSMKQSER